MKTLHRLLVLLLVVGSWSLVHPLAASADPGFRLPFEPGRQFRITQGPAQHAGGPSPAYNRHAVDFAMPVGTPVLASGDGSIFFEGYDSTGAIQVRIDHGGDRCTQYVHLSRTIIDRGQAVRRGQLIGYSGNTGQSTGPHLHFNMVGCSSQLSREVVNTLEMGTSYPVGMSAPSQNSLGHNPQGSFDQVSSPAPGRIRVRGWAFDRDDAGAAVTIHAYVGGPAGSPGARGIDLGPASGSRPDVGAAYPGVGDHHGFDVTFDDPGGRRPVYVYALNRPGGGGQNVLLGHRDVQVADPDPVGYVDEVVSPQGGEVSIRGWTFDPSAPTTPLAFHVYVGGPAGDPAAEGLAFGPADASRPDVDRVHPGVGPRHGIDWSFATTRSGRQPVYVYGIDVGPGDNVLIGSATVDIAPGPPRIAAQARARVLGKARVGRVLRTSSAWTVRDVGTRVQWLRDGRRVRGATSTSYRLRRADQGHRMSVRVTADKPGYTSARSSSPRTKRVGRARRR